MILISTVAILVGTLMFTQYALAAGNQTFISGGGSTLNINVDCINGSQIHKHITHRGDITIIGSITVNCGGGGVGSQGPPGPRGPKGDPGNNATICVILPPGETCGLPSPSP